MGEDLGTIRTTINGSLRIASRPERLTREAGAVLTREIMERSGLVRWLVQRLHDPRKPELITHPLSELVMTTLLLLVQGWRDRDDADPLRDDPLLRLATSERRGLSPLESHTKQGWSLKRLRERVLRLPARVLVHGRRAVVVIGQAAAGLWQGLWNKLMRWQVQPAT